MNPPIPKDLLNQWAKELAGKIQDYLTEMRPDLIWATSAALNEAQYQPSHSVSNNIALRFTFNANHKPNPNGPKTKPSLEDFSIKNLSKRKLK